LGNIGTNAVGAFDAPVLCKAEEKRNIFSHLRWGQDETLSDTWNIAEIFVKNCQQIYPKRVDIEKKDGGLFTKE
jgi:hypothetical protein